MNIGKEQTAIRACSHYPKETDYLCYSGGKDSDCVRILAELAGVNYDLVHNLTTVDAPETVQRTALEMGAEFVVTSKGGVMMNGDNAVNRQLVEEFYKKNVYRVKSHCRLDGGRCMGIFALSRVRQ